MESFLKAICRVQCLSCQLLTRALARKAGMSTGCGATPPPPPPISPPSSAKQALGSLSASETPRSRISFCDQHADLLVGNSVFLFKGTVQLHGRLVHVQSPFQLSPSFILPLSFLCNFFFPD